MDAEGRPPIRPAWVVTDHERILSAAECWLESAALQRLITALGGPDPAARDLRALIRWSAGALDTRRGAERRDAAPVAWPTDRIRALLSAAGPLGLLDTAEPCRSSYAMTALLGGATTGNRLRTAFARNLSNRGVDLGVLVAVTAERTLSDHEHTTDPDSVADRTEWANLLRHLADAFGPLRVGTTATGGAGGTAWQDQKFETATGGELRVLVAASRDERRRANTGDGLAFLLQRIPLAQRRHILIITSAIYTPYQFFVGAPIVSSDGAQHVEFIGTPTRTDGDANLLAQQLAQELHAALNAAVELRQSGRPPSRSGHDPL